MKRIGGALATVCAAAFAGPALAEGWVVMDLGETETREICMDRADRILQSYIDAHGGHSVESDTWTKYGYDLEPGDNDVVIFCPVVNGGVYNGFLAVYGAFTDSHDDHTDEVAETLQRMWEEDASGEGEGAETADSAAARAAEDLDRALSALDEARDAVSAAQAKLQAVLSGDGSTSDHLIDVPHEGEGDGEDWIDLDSVLAPLKQEMRDGVSGAAPAEEAPAEEAPAEEAPAVEEPAQEETAPVAPVAPAEEEEDVAPIAPR